MWIFFQADESHEMLNEHMTFYGIFLFFFFFEKISPDISWESSALFSQNKNSKNQSILECHLL